MNTTLEKRTENLGYFDYHIAELVGNIPKPVWNQLDENMFEKRKQLTDCFEGDVDTITQFYTATRLFTDYLKDITKEKLTQCAKTSKPLVWSHPDKEHCIREMVKEYFDKDKLQKTIALGEEICSYFLAFDNRIKEMNEILCDENHEKNNRMIFPELELENKNLTHAENRTGEALIHLAYGWPSLKSITSNPEKFADRINELYLRIPNIFDELYNRCKMPEEIRKNQDDGTNIMKNYISLSKIIEKDKFLFTKKIFTLLDIMRRTMKEKTK